MIRTQLWTTVLVLLASGALAAPSMDAPPGEHRIEQTGSWGEWTPSEDGVLPASVHSFGSVFSEEGIEIARKSHTKGGHRGGAKSKSRGGFSKGSERNARRGAGSGRSGGRSGDRDVDIDADDLDDAYTSDEEKVGAAVVGGVIGLGVGKMISDSEDPDE